MSEVPHTLPIRRRDLLTYHISAAQCCITQTGRILLKLDFLLTTPAAVLAKFFSPYFNTTAQFELVIILILSDVPIKSITIRCNCTTNPVFIYNY